VLELAVWYLQYSKVSLALQIQDHDNDTSSVLFEPEGFAEADGNIVQPVSLTIPSEVLRSAFKSSTLEQSAVRTVFLLHRKSILFPSNETANWVNVVATSGFWVFPMLYILLNMHHKAPVL